MLWVCEARRWQPELAGCVMGCSGSEEVSVVLPLQSVLQQDMRKYHKAGVQ